MHSPSRLSGPPFHGSRLWRLRLDVWGTTLQADTDFTEFRLMRGDRLIGVRRISGY